ncbi:hypothetical protein MKLM6_0901 [Methylomonas koyamae]|nr:hypothetical protein MKLM6_0901 [Methylomonas koyamae]
MALLHWKFRKSARSSPPQRPRLSHDIGHQTCRDIPNRLPAKHAAGLKLAGNAPLIPAYCEIGTVLLPLCRAEHRRVWADRPGRGAAGMPRVFGGLGQPFRKPRSNPPERRIKAAWGGLFFGYFLLAKQKKGSRLSVREPTFKTAVALATQDTKAYSPRGHKMPCPPCSAAVGPRLDRGIRLLAVQ